MFTKAGLKIFHVAAHSSLEVLLAHLGTMPVELLLAPLNGFARRNIRDQMFHTIACEMFWVHGLRLLPMPKVNPEDYPTVESLVEYKGRASRETLEFIDRLSEEELNRDLDRLPEQWLGPARSPASSCTTC